ncbi:MAG: hypothetical protein B7Z58_01770 [Acidiphilium sp. 37-64-53]|uniref:hypothetical protein n=1 Tax=Acidiphilium TaxID=522 RepID=UPI000BD51BE5|nr:MULTISPECIES: hypothetical protein [Acidiphilium]OYW03924.1 MAG: hypothetical protein B7Z58_01770 [Acidiphilium sp. 37-64-53]HQT83856.1 hypothetical protein [Acidiphilium rubrum]
MIETTKNTTTTDSHRATSPRVVDVATRAEAMARALASMASTPSERDLIGRITMQAVRRAFGAAR